MRVRQSAMAWGMVLALGALAAACSKSDAPVRAPEAEIVSVALATVGTAGTAAEFSATGTVRFKRETALSFNTNGRIATINVLEGQAVVAGQQLARLDPTGLDAANAAARAEVNAEAQTLTKKITYLSNLNNGWRVHGKTGTGRLADGSAAANDQIGWFIGWAENGKQQIVFVHQIQDQLPQEHGYAGPRAKAAMLQRLPALLPVSH